MKGKRTIALLCAAAMVLSLAACGSGGWSGQTLTGQVTEIDGSTVTLQLGELTEGGAPGDQNDQNNQNDQTAPNGQDDPNSQGGQPDQTGQAPSDGQTPPDRPDGTDGGTPPEKPDDAAAGRSGDAPSAPPDGAPSGGMGGFTAGDETATLDFSSAAIAKDGAGVSLDDIAVGDVLTCTVGDGDAVTSAEVLSVGGGFGGGAFTQGDSAYTITEDGT